MKLRAIFDKKVDRSIEGVIKADDEASLKIEIEEYVLTNEVENRLGIFLDAYNNYEGANGVWVSGFFGSGKSHLLKMLALILENREVDGTNTLDLFLPKCDDNEILKGDLKRAAELPSKSILFNIDQKADVISKTQMDALLAVFVKVFDETCGYYGKQGHIAQFERDLDSRDLFQKFKDAFESVSGKHWHIGREQALLESANIAKAYAEVSGSDVETAKGILDKYRTEYRVSIEDFANQVNQYIDRQEPNFRLNFFVDEVGQYIADNVKLMTNLQTIAESLATKSRGRAWIIVTAQEDMNTVVGEMNKQQSNDFSKIQARFANKMKLTSQNVDEVIQKRLLMKNDDGVQLLSNIYHIESNNFKTLFDFADGSQSYKNYKDRDHFIHCYPFIPYQFGLFQSAIQNLSAHSAFEGKHSSVGERSMLGVFQEVAIQISENEVGRLATFEMMFEGIRSALKTKTQQAILKAENQLDDDFAKRLLKALFLIKYVKEFKATVRNLCILMLESFDDDVAALRKRVEEALNLLEQQTYIQRNGETYEYLTDEEKDIEQEIKNTEIESADVASELDKLIFDEAIRLRKVRYDENGQDYAFSRKLDDKLQGREHELAVHVISPFHEHAENEQMLITNSTYKADELFVLMPADDRLIRDVKLYKQTEKYIKQNISNTQKETAKRILNDKGFQNKERYADLRLRVKTLISKAKLLVAGNEIEIGTEDPQTRVIQGFHNLISRSYPNLKMLRGITYSENDISRCLKPEESLFENDAIGLAESEQEMFAFIQSNNKGGVRTTVKSLVDRFERKPYGWYYAAIICTLAKLCACGKIEVRSDSHLLEDDDLSRGLRNSAGFGNMVLEPQIEFTASQIRGLKDFYEDFFDAPAKLSEAKSLGQESAKAFAELINELKVLSARASQYPFLNALTPVVSSLEEVSGKPYTWYLTELKSQEDALLDMKENTIDPVRKFMSGPQREIYDSARQFLQKQDANFAYIDDEQIKTIQNTLAEPECFKGNRIQQIKRSVDELQEKIDNTLKSEREKATDRVNELKDKLTNTDEFSSLDEQQQVQLTQEFDEFINEIISKTLIAVISDTLRRFEDETYNRLLSRAMFWSQPQPEPVKPYPPTTGGATTPVEPNEVKEPQIQIINSKSIKVNYQKPLLASETDVEGYLESMRDALMEEIRQGKRIQI
ncbi:hypothetical Protein MAMP_00263 [Methylophaga aminisulfidivorans MP]|uniref:WH2 domain-containing protein n=1 Tax=Methylophaga aminisulfidivorans MP TaxID=1026882 RepID=F5T1I1_9GAMM|nr:BREX system P-loop protein BrxC [Methylophaga aminisulfidivorans]EGL53077.1 hypothetical Protein MAMP_00263 [Methylophaga aminisulfidivorans MP]